MKLSLDQQELAAYLAAQVSTFFPDSRVMAADLNRPVESALERMEYSFRQIRDFSDGDRTFFSHHHTDQYAAFIYFVANCIYRDEGDIHLAGKLYALNKALHSIELFYEVAMPDVFMLVHPVGTVLGRATYGNNFAVYQNCTVGGKNRIYPTLGEKILMYSGSRIIGRSTIGDNCVVAPGAIVLDSDVPSNMLISGTPPNTQFTPTDREHYKKLFFS